MANGATQKSIPVDNDVIGYLIVQAELNARTFAQECRYRLRQSMLAEIGVDQAAAPAEPEGT